MRRVPSRLSWLLLVSELFLVDVLGRPVQAFTESWRSSTGIGRAPHTNTRQFVGRTAYQEFADDPEPTGSRNMYIDSLRQSLSYDDADEIELARRKENLRNKKLGVGQYKVTLSMLQPFGFTLAQVDVGRRFSNVELDTDTLKLATPTADATNNADIKRRRIDPKAVASQLEPEFRGIVVTSVVEGGQAWAVGVRPGDILYTASATLGDAMWAKTSLEGVKSAISSRRVVAGSMDFVFRRLQDAASSNEFELTLTKPLGFQIQESSDGYVEVSGISENAPSLVKYGIQVGDRVVAVGSSIGHNLWPVSTVEGVISACTSRLPGQPVTMRFERPQEFMSSASSAPVATVNATMATTTTGAFQSTTAAQPAPGFARDTKELVKRCRDILKRYSSEDSEKSYQTKIDNLRVVVADKVVDALASASVSLDCGTLARIMNFYIAGRQPESAIRVFQSVVGLRADGSPLPVGDDVVKGTTGGKFVPNESALDLYTGCLLLKAHSINKDLDSVKRVLFALDGRSGVDVNGVESAPWPWTGAYGSLKPDSRCYNIAIAAAEKVGGDDALQFAFSLFNAMDNPKKASTDESSRPVRNAVTYNTLISALINMDRAKEAFQLFDQMKQAGVRPDKFTYTSLLKGCDVDADIQELLYDMRSRGVVGDIVTYNTIIKALCEKRDLSSASKFVTEMESRGISPNAMTYGLLMNALVKADKARAALSLFESACASQRTSALTENVFLYTTAITAAAVLKDHERALELVSRMSANGVKPNMNTLTSVMKACLADGQPELAAGVFRRIENPDSYATYKGIQALAETGETATAAAIIRAQRGPRKVLTGKQMMESYNTVLRATLRDGNYELAREVLSDLMYKRFIPSRATLDCIVDGCGVSSVLTNAQTSEEGAVETFKYLLYVIDRLGRRNLPVESNLYTAVLALANNAGGLYRQVGALLVRARSREEGEQVLKQGVEEVVTSQQEKNQQVGWESLFDEMGKSDVAVHDVDVHDLPPLNVRVAKNHMRNLLRVEQLVSGASSSKSKAKKKKRRQASTLETTSATATIVPATTTN